MTGTEAATTATTVQIALAEGMRFEATGEDGVVLSMDSSKEHGGVGGGFRPMELLLVGLGGCTAMDVLSILRKKREKVTGYRIHVAGTPADTIPHVYTRMTIHHVIEGNDISDISVQRAIELSEMKYCSAFAMLSASAPITSTYEIRPSGPED